MELGGSWVNELFASLQKESVLGLLFTGHALD
jgi:hypothetical protein